MRYWKAFVLAFVLIALAGFLAFGQSLATGPVATLTDQNGRKEVITPCSLDAVIVTPAGSACFLGENRVGPFCPADARQRFERLPRCTRAQVEAIASVRAGELATLTYGTLLRIARDGVAK